MPQQRHGSPQLAPQVAVHSGASGCAIPSKIAGREGLIEVRQRRRRQALDVGMAEQTNDSVESRRPKCGVALTAR